MKITYKDLTDDLIKRCFKLDNAFYRQEFQWDKFEIALPAFLTVAWRLLLRRCWIPFLFLPEEFALEKE